MSPIIPATNDPVAITFRDRPPDATEYQVVVCPSCSFRLMTWTKQLPRRLVKWDGKRWVARLKCPICKHPSMRKPR